MLYRDGQFRPEVELEMKNAEFIVGNEGELNQNSILYKIRKNISNDEDFISIIF